MPELSMKGAISTWSLCTCTVWNSVHQLTPSDGRNTTNYSQLFKQAWIVCKCELRIKNICTVSPEVFCFSAPGSLRPGYPHALHLILALWNWPQCSPTLITSHIFQSCYKQINKQTQQMTWMLEPSTHFPADLDVINWEDLGHCMFWWTNRAFLYMHTCVSKCMASFPAG